MTKLKGNNERIILLSKELKKKKVVEYGNEEYLQENICS